MNVKMLQGLTVCLIAALAAAGCGTEEAEEAASVADSDKAPAAVAAQNTVTEAATEPGEIAAEDVDVEARQSLEIETITPAEIGDMVAAQQGKVLVANLWATWCPPCIEEMPELASFYEDTSREDVAFLSVSVDHPSTIESAVKPFLEKQALPFTPVVTEALPDEVGEAMGIDAQGGVPVTVVYNREGEVVKTWVGAITEEMLLAEVEPLL